MGAQSDWNPCQEALFDTTEDADHVRRTFGSNGRVWDAVGPDVIRDGQIVDHLPGHWRLGGVVSNTF